MSKLVSYIKNLFRLSSETQTEKPVEPKPNLTKTAPKSAAAFKNNAVANDKPVAKMKPAVKPAPKPKADPQDFYPTKDMAVKKVAKKSPGRPKKNPEA